MALEKTLAPATFLHRSPPQFCALIISDSDLPQTETRMRQDTKSSHDHSITRFPPPHVLTFAVRSKPHHNHASRASHVLCGTVMTEIQGELAQSLTCACAVLVAHLPVKSRPCSRPATFAPICPSAPLSSSPSSSSKGGVPQPVVEWLIRPDGEVGHRGGVALPVSAGTATSSAWGPATVMQLLVPVRRRGTAVGGNCAWAVATWAVVRAVAAWATESGSLRVCL